MKRHLTQCSLDSFYVGSSGRSGQEGYWRRAKRLILAPMELSRLVTKGNYDLVHLNPSFDAKSLVRDGLLMLALRACGYRHILFYFHGFDLALHQHILGMRLLRCLTAWTLNKAALITVLDNRFREALIALGVDPSHIVVTRTMFEGAALSAAIDQTLPSARTARRFILFLSRFDHEKGGRELLEAFGALAADYPDLDLVMAGDGAEEDFLRLQARASGLGARIDFTGYIGGLEKARLLRDCTLFALPTYYRSEGMPVAVLEAMGAGKPLLVGKVGALRSLVKDPENGVVLDHVSARAIEGGLRRLLNDPSVAELTGKRNAELAWAKYEAGVVCQDIEKFYQRVAVC